MLQHPLGEAGGKRVVAPVSGPAAQEERRAAAGRRQVAVARPRSAALEESAVPPARHPHPVANATISRNAGVREEKPAQSTRGQGSPNAQLRAARRRLHRARRLPNALRAQHVGWVPASRSVK